jgi:periplasmic divalent cation tolerance protein
VVAVQVTAPSWQVADDLGQAALAARLAACAQVSGPIRSTYWWRGQLQQADEWVCTCKTTARRFDELAALLRGAHPYDVPEVVATAVVAGDPDYLAWVVAETGDVR